MGDFVKFQSYNFVQFCRGLPAEMPVFTGGNAAVWRRRQKGARAPYGSLAPSCLPQTLLKTRLPSVARLNGGVRELGSGRLSAYMQLSCPEFRLRGWQRCQCAARRCRAAAKRCEKLRFHQGCTLRAPDVTVGPSHFAARPKGVAAQRKVRGVKRGQETILGVLSPFALRRGYGVSAGSPRQSPRRGHGVFSAARRRLSLPPKAAIPRR